MSDFRSVCEEGERISREEGFRVMQAEIASLHAEIERLRFTDAEREAVMAGLRSLERTLYADPDNLGGKYRDMRQDAATLRGLLERLGGER